MAERIEIKSRDGKRIVVLVDHPTRSRGTAFVAHGLGGYKDQPHIAMFAHAFVDAGFTSVRWDTRNTFGESEGDYAEATITNYLEDMEDVIAWARTQPWFVEPFMLCGHSLGGVCSLVYAERYPEQVLGLAPIATVVSGELSMKAKIAEHGAATVTAWKASGWIEQMGSNGKLKRLKWHELEDRMRYDALRAAHKLRMPKLFVVGDIDTATPVWMQEAIVTAVPEPKELHIIPGAPHTYKTDEDIATVRELLTAWLAKYWPQ